LAEGGERYPHSGVENQRHWIEIVVEPRGPDHLVKKAGPTPRLRNEA
jgi:hypothetical protein